MRVHCNACGRDAEEVTATCPYCGVAVSPPRRNRVTLGALVFGFVAATVEMAALLWFMYCR